MLNSTYQDRNAALASLLATATVVLNTDRGVTKSCSRCAMTLLGIDLSLSWAVAAEHSCLQVGLAPWQPKRIRSYIEEELDSNAGEWPQVPTTLEENQPVNYRVRRPTVATGFARRM